LNGKSASVVKNDICNSQEAQNYSNGGNSRAGESSRSNSNSEIHPKTNFNNAPVCSIPVGNGDVLVNFDTRSGLRSDNSLSAAQKFSNKNIPAGIYNIKVQTWDDHDVNGGQGQNDETVKLFVLNSNGNTIYTSGKTNDIPNRNNSITSTVARNANIGNGSRVLAQHAAYPSRNPESVVPVCAVFERIDAPNPPTPPNPPSPNNFDIECRVSDTRVEEGDDVRFEVEIDGGNSPFDIEWSGDEDEIRGFDDDARVQTVEMDDEGRYYLSVSVTDDDGRRRTDSCPMVRVEDDDRNDDLRVQCDISDTTISEDDRVTIEVDIDGGDGPYDIQWSGDDNEIDDFDDEDRSQRVRIEDEGTYRLKVTVEDDDGNRDSDTCTIRVRDEDDDDDDDINVISSLSSTDGELAGLSSIYLNQVPYTGPEDTMKILGFLSLILIWSSAIAYYLMKDKKKKKISTSIQAFKEANKTRLNV
jgi:hypothetical protein